jgi:threonine aldolase
MREAMARAEVGDEQEREDPTVLELERRVAELLGQEEAVYLPTATMANQIALAVQTRPGDELVLEAAAHIVRYERGGAARHSGLQLRPLAGDGGTFSPEQLREAFRRGDEWEPATGLVAVEDTHNAAGGAVWPLDRLDALLDAAREVGVPAHLDGARLPNAAVALDVPPARLAGRFDTVSLCLSKGLGAPLGALIAGSREPMRRARREKHAFGGAMRQAGIVAAAGLYAPDHNLARLAEEHVRARPLAEGLVEAGVPVELDRVQTNFVQVPLADDLSVPEALGRLREHGVLLSDTGPRTLRALTHLDVSDEDVERATRLIPAALGGRRRLAGAAKSEAGSRARA